MGAFDGPTGTTLAKHIFVAEKGDYYEIGDGLPQEAHPPRPEPEFVAGARDETARPGGTSSRQLANREVDPV